MEEPGVDPGQVVDLLDGEPHPESGGQAGRPAGSWAGSQGRRSAPCGSGKPPSPCRRPPSPKRPVSRERRPFWKASLKVRPMDMASPTLLHGGGQLVLGARELLEGPAGDLDHAVVDGRLEAGVGLAGDVVFYLVQGVAHGQLGGDLGDGEPGGLGGQGRWSATPGGSSR